MIFGWVGYLVELVMCLGFVGGDGDLIGLGWFLVWLDIILRIGYLVVLGWVGPELWLDLAGLGMRFCCSVDSVGLEFGLDWVGHLVVLELCAGRNFGWIEHFGWVIHLFWS